MTLQQDIDELATRIGEFLIERLRDLWQLDDDAEFTPEQQRAFLQYGDMYIENLLDVSICKDDGKIDWEKLVRFNSAKIKP